MAKRRNLSRLIRPLAPHPDWEPSPQQVKRNFMVQYVLGRCRGRADHLGGRDAALEAAEAWTAILELTPNV